MTRKQRKYELVAAAANAVRTRRAAVNGSAGDDDGMQCAALPMIEISDADYRTVHLPCEALEESLQHPKEDGHTLED